MKQEVLVGDPATRGEIEIDPGAQRATGYRQQEDRSDHRDEADPAGADGGEFLIRAEPAENQQRGREQPHRKRKHQDIRNQKPQRLENHPQRSLPADQQFDDFPQHIAEQKHKRENGHGHEERGENLAGKIPVQRFHGAMTLNRGGATRAGVMGAARDS